MAGATKSLSVTNGEDCGSEGVTPVGASLCTWGVLECRLICDVWDGRRCPSGLGCARWSPHSHWEVLPPQRRAPSSYAPPAEERPDTGVVSWAFSPSHLKREPCVSMSHVQTHTRACTPTRSHTSPAQPQADKTVRNPLTDASPGHPRALGTGKRPGRAVPCDAERSTCLVVVLVFKCKEPE